jgi:hypothetical protein
VYLQVSFPKLEDNYTKLTALPFGEYSTPKTKRKIKGEHLSPVEKMG